VPTGKKLRKGDYETRIAALRSRLIISGDLTDTTIGNQDYFVYKLRQDPANSNALGRIKFIFPNEFSIYLHDTPTRNLFNKTRRTFSSGCIRIEKPVELAAYLLQNNSKWSLEKLVAAVNRKKNKIIFFIPDIANN